MADDGRTFFASKDSLDPRDKDGSITDVYEYVDGRPQLITTGQANQDFTGGSEVFSLLAVSAYIGLESVSHNGVDVYFSTFETLVKRDHNGRIREVLRRPHRRRLPRRTRNWLPCEAADECHGADSSPPPPPAINSAGNLGASGNVQPATKKKAQEVEAEEQAQAAPLEEAAQAALDGGAIVNPRSRATLLVASIAALLGARGLRSPGPPRRTTSTSNRVSKASKSHRARARPAATPTSTSTTSSASTTRFGEGTLRIGMPLRTHQSRSTGPRASSATRTWRRSAP